MVFTGNTFKCRFDGIIVDANTNLVGGQVEVICITPQHPPTILYPEVAPNGVDFEMDTRVTFKYSGLYL